MKLSNCKDPKKEYAKNIKHTIKHYKKKGCAKIRKPCSKLTKSVCTDQKEMEGRPLVRDETMS